MQLAQIALFAFFVNYELPNFWVKCHLLFCKYNKKFNLYKAKHREKVLHLQREALKLKLRNGHVN